MARGNPKESDLVVLQYSQNPCYLRLKRVKDAVEGLEVDLEKGTWSHRHYGEMKIGESNRCANSHARDIVGVYDGRRIEHLSRMLHVATEITEASSRGAIYMD